MLFEQGTRERPVQRTWPLTGPLGRREHVDTHGLMGLAADVDDNVVIDSDLVAELRVTNPRRQHIAGATVVPLEPIGSNLAPTTRREYALKQFGRRAREGQASHGSVIFPERSTRFKEKGRCQRRPARRAVRPDQRSLRVPNASGM
jgi:hypothetical protein